MSTLGLPDDRERRLHATTDAQVWATEFLSMINAPQAAIAIDHGFMIGWFANAIEIGRAAGLRGRRTSHDSMSEGAKRPTFTNPEGAESGWVRDRFLGDRPDIDGNGLPPLGANELESIPAPGRREPTEVLTTNSAGDYVPAVPQPLWTGRGLRRPQCECGERFKSADQYRGHYAYHHILNGEPTDVRKGSFPETGE